MRRLAGLGSNGDAAICFCGEAIVPTKGCIIRAGVNLFVSPISALDWLAAAYAKSAQQGLVLPIINKCADISEKFYPVYSWKALGVKILM